ncbi:MAG: hypothetical protein JNN08_31940 [Bryobacterales bacterium]|nr:hypothetical protein [Bryobacterales bacterium]
MSETATSARARAAAGRGAQWLLALLQQDGQMGNASALDAYYKVPCGLLFTGHRAEAERVYDYSIGRFLQPDGDLDGTGVGWYDRFRIYPHTWLTWAATELGRPDELSRFLVSRWNPETGGFRADAEGTEEIMTTSMAGLACLRAGHAEVAAGVARWLERMMQAQPDLSRGLIHVWKPGVGLTEGDGSVWYIVNAKELRQWYFQYGISAAFLADYARRSGEQRWVELAREYLHASAHCREDVYRTPQSGKIGWGAAWTYGLTQRIEDAALVDAVVDGLCALQCGDGSWNPEGIYEAEPKSEATARLDVTAEFAALLGQMQEMGRV